MKRIFLLSLTMLFILVVNGQDKSTMERERAEIQKEIRELQAVYNKIKGQKNASLGQANVVKRKLALQEKYLNNINRELRSINDDLYKSQLEINRMNRELDTLKAQYARSVVYAYKNRSTYDYLNFIFSASSFNDAMKRVAYLKSYRSYREDQVANIQQTQARIEQHRQEQIAKRTQKNTALQTQAEQVKVLEVERKEKDAVVAKLKTQEKQLQREIADKRKRDKQIQNAISAVVRREIEEARREAAKRAEAEAKANPTTTTTPNVAGSRPKATTSKSKSYLDLNERDVALNSSFEKNKGKLPWPVDQAYVKLHYGSYEVEGTSLKNINPGITLGTPIGSSVKSVFDGEVAAVYSIGEGSVVTIRHGKYFTTYSNLSGVSVSKGAQVKTGQVIGRARAAVEGDGGEVEFLLQNEMNKMNPEPWLRK